MKVEGGNRASLRRYLLGDLSEADRDSVEDRIMSEKDMYEQLLLAEDELVDEYVSNSLSETDRASFSRNFLRMPELQQRVRFARALRQHAVRSPSPSTFHWHGVLFNNPALTIACTVALFSILTVVWLG